MFENGIEKASKFTRPIHTISRLRKGNKVIPGAATLFFVNNEGWAISCKHVTQMIKSAETINQQFLTDKKSRRIGHGSNGILQLKHSFVDCVDTLQGLTIHEHPSLDLALIKFNGFSQLLVQEFPVFKKDHDQIKQGQFLCRLGYPFPEFNNFRYNTGTDDIEWLGSGNSRSPIFPIEGMITRFLGNGKDGVHGIELSTPGLRGQSGGPLFDQNGVIFGMQSRTKHLHLGFDLEEKEILVNGHEKKVSDYSFIHLGECVHVSAIKSFMNQYHVHFDEQ